MPTPQSSQPMIRTNTGGATGSWDDQEQPGFFTRLAQSEGLPSTDAELYTSLHNFIHPPQSSTSKPSLRNEMINSIVGQLVAPAMIAQGLYHTGKTVVSDARNKNYGGALGGAIGLVGQVANPEEDPEVDAALETPEVDPDKWYTPPEDANVQRGVQNTGPNTSFTLLRHTRSDPERMRATKGPQLGPMIRQNADTSPAYREKFSVFHNPAEKLIANMTPEERMNAMENERQLFIQHKAPINNNINSNALEINDADTGNLELMPHPVHDERYAIPVERQPFNPVLNADPFATTEADEDAEEAPPIIRTRKRR